MEFSFFLVLVVYLCFSCYVQKCLYLECSCGRENKMASSRKLEQNVDEKL
jgi:hypothetical protein